MILAAVFYGGLIGLAAWHPEPGPTSRLRHRDHPNILMIGSDTLRADRVGGAGYHRRLTPNIDGLVARGTLFTHCYVPCARTAPSLVSLLTGTWPHRHGIRDNFVSDEDALLGVPAIPELLREQGYQTAVISDWCGADMGKFSFGFDLTDLPEDQWNLKYLIRQGPKDLRLFVSLFMHNRLGRRTAPEIYYLGGVPLTSQLGHEARRLVSRLALQEAPFLLNVFYSTTHPPFASEYPYYLRCANPSYQGESKFAMTRLTDPFEIIRRQGDSRKEFDLDQVIDLYDGCVTQFDSEVGHMLSHLERCGLLEDTIVVIYSDHGMEFFEHDTWGQGNSVFGDASARVPLVIVDPRIPGRGATNEVVRNIDLAPTLLELTGVPVPKTTDGESLVSLLHGSPPHAERVVFNETGIWVTDLPGTPVRHLRYPDLPELLHVPDKVDGTLALKPEYERWIVRAKDRMVRQGRWKLTYQPMTDGALVKLFDVVEDPECRHDLRLNHPEIARRLLTLLEDWLRIDGISGLGEPVDPATINVPGFRQSIALADSTNNPLTNPEDR
jgi:arylsulfatase A-like enzyme